MKRLFHGIQENLSLDEQAGITGGTTQYSNGTTNFKNALDDGSLHNVTGLESSTTIVDGHVTSTSYAADVVTAGGAAAPHAIDGDQYNYLMSEATAQHDIQTPDPHASEPDPKNSGSALPDWTLPNPSPSHSSSENPPPGYASNGSGYYKIPVPDTSVDANGYETYNGSAPKLEYNYDGSMVAPGSSPEAPPSGFGTWTQTQVSFNGGESDGTLSNVVAIGHTDKAGSAYAEIENGSGFSTETISADQFNQLLNQGEETFNVGEAQTSIGLTFDNQPV